MTREIVKERMIYNCLEAIKKRTTDPVIRSKIDNAKTYLQFSGDRKTGLQKIISMSALAVGVDEGKVRTKSRKSELVLARAICYYHLRNKYGYSYERIGKLFNGRGHDTVLSSLNNLNGYLETQDPEAVNAVNRFNRLMNRSNEKTF